jgi:hypothetical protein
VRKSAYFLDVMRTSRLYYLHGNFADFASNNVLLT